MPTDDRSAPSPRPFDRPEVVRWYERADALTPAEELLFDAWVPPGSRVLDLGVGTGRTTQRLARDAADYLGIDIAPSMIEAARRRHPDHRFEVGDATTLDGLDDASFDVVVFSYNGLDYVPGRAGRDLALGEIHRVLRPGGVLIHSSHDPRALVRRRNPELGAKGWAVAALQTARRVGRRAFTAALARGEGTIVDPVHGGLTTYMVTPRHGTAELRRHGLAPLVTVAGSAPHPGRRWGTDWWYYVSQRPALRS